MLSISQYSVYGTNVCTSPFEVFSLSEITQTYYELIQTNRANVLLAGLRNVALYLQRGTTPI